MTQAQYAAIVNRQRQIALARQKQDVDLSNNNISVEELNTTKQRLEKELANKKQKKSNSEMVTPIPKNKDTNVNIPLAIPGNKSAETTKQPLRQEVPVYNKNGFKKNTTVSDDNENTKKTPLQDFINKTTNNNYDEIIKEKTKLIDTYRTERDRLDSKLETLTTRYELKIKKHEDMIITLNETIRNLTEMLNKRNEDNIITKHEVETNTSAADTSAADTSVADTSTEDTSVADTSAVDTSVADTSVVDTTSNNTEIDVKLDVVGEDIKVEITPKNDSNDLSNN